MSEDLLGSDLLDHTEPRMSSTSSKMPDLGHDAIVDVLSRYDLTKASLLYLNYHTDEAVWILTEMYAGRRFRWFTGDDPPANRRGVVVGAEIDDSGCCRLCLRFDDEKEELITWEERYVLEDSRPLPAWGSKVPSHILSRKEEKGAVNPEKRPAETRMDEYPEEGRRPQPSPKELCGWITRVDKAQGIVYANPGDVGRVIGRKGGNIKRIGRLTGRRWKVEPDTQ